MEVHLMVARSTAILACCAAVLIACESPVAAWLETDIHRDAALGVEIRRDVTAPVQTDSLVYHLTRDGRVSFGVPIGFAYRNDTGRDISIINCHGGLNISLEKWVDGEWQRFWVPVLLLCLSPPIEIRAGSVYRNVMRFYGALPGNNISPAFRDADLNGVYRFSWAGLVHGYNDRVRGFGQSVGPLHSNPFLLVAPTE
jgi:hypothetical protein